MSIPAPDEISIEDPLCNSSLGSMVTLDYVTPLTSLERISERTVEQIVDIPSSGSGFGHGSSSSAGPADEDFTGFFFRTFPMEKSAECRWQVVSAQLGGHVSSSTLSAYQMPRAGEPRGPMAGDEYCFRLEVIGILS